MFEPGGLLERSRIDEARSRIAEAKRTGAVVLDLSSLRLKQVPEELFELGPLKGPYLGLTIRKAGQLTSLDLQGNKIGDAGAQALGRLTALTSGLRHSI
jgi:hypothetical protein